MVSIEDIPAEVRWEIAARSATAMTGAYGVFLWDVFGTKFNEIVKQIWIEGGKEAKVLALKLSLPVKDAKDVDETLGSALPDSLRSGDHLGECGSGNEQSC